MVATHRLRAGVMWANTFNKFDPTSVHLVDIKNLAGDAKAENMAWLLI
jgi:hypothetical protein